MSRPDDAELPLSLIQFYRTAAYPCSYLQNRSAHSLVAAPPYLIDAPIYSQLIRRGFRRSGLFTYRPDCDTCHECIPVRIPVAQFIPDRSQRRCLKKNANLEINERPLADDTEHYALYERYQATRHPGGGMDQGDPEQYSDFLLRSHVNTRLIEFRDPGAQAALRMVSLIRRNPVTVDRSDDRPGATLVDIAASFNRLPESERRESEIVGFLGGLGAVSGNAIADEPSTDGVGVGVDSDIATEPAPAQRGDTATWHCVSIDGEPRNWITRPVLADMDELSIIVEEG